MAHHRRYGRLRKWTPWDLVTRGIPLHSKRRHQEVVDNIEQQALIVRVQKRMADKAMEKYGPHVLTYHGIPMLNVSRLDADFYDGARSYLGSGPGKPLTEYIE